MDWDKIKFSFSIVIFAILFLLALPVFKIGDFQYPNIDFSLIDPNSKLGNMRRSRGLYPTREVSATLNFSTTEIPAESKEQILTEYLNLIRARASKAGFYDLIIRSEIDATTYKLVFSYPDYYTNISKYTEWLTGKAELNFNQFYQQSVVNANIYDSDISGVVSINYNVQLGSHLQFQFAESSTSTVTQLLTPQSESQVGFFVMDVDGKEQFFIRQYEQNDVTSNTVRAIPVAFSGEETSDKNILLQIVKAYFNEKDPLEYDFTVDSNIKVVSSEMSPDGTRFIAIMSFVSILLVGVLFFLRFKITGFIKYLLMIGSFVSLTIVLLKYSNAALSIGTLIGFFAILMLGILQVNKYCSLDNEDEVNLVAKKYRDFSLVLILLAVFLSVGVKGVWLAYDAVGAISIASVALFLMNLFNFKFISILQNNESKSK